MKVLARVNILDGRAVRLPHGDIAEAISLDADPVSRALGWIGKGAHRIHIVDLNAAAFGDYRNRGIIQEIIEATDAPVQVAGGVRSPQEAARLIDMGAWRVVMGTAAIEEQVMVWDLCRTYPERIAVSLDVMPDEELVVRGWTAHSGRFLEEVLIELSSAGVAAFLISEAGRDALEEPANLGILRHALATVDEPVIAAGGARDLADLQSLSDLRQNGRALTAVIVGREITEGRFKMRQAVDLLGDSD